MKSNDIIMIHLKFHQHFSSDWYTEKEESRHERNSFSFDEDRRNQENKERLNS